MSYTSKYTGPEIDGLLDSIGGINVTRKILWEGSITNIGDMAILSESMENYDYLIVESGYCLSPADNLYRHYPATILSVSQILESYEDGGIFCGPNYINAVSSDPPSQVGFFFKSTDVNTLGVYATFTSAANNSVEMTKIIGIKLSSTASGASSSNPIGAIVPIMGTQAPKDHLICDGAVLNISEYKELADYFEAQFGSKNHFGGDGTTTFAIPDLRNEFLRGYHGEAEKQLSGEIGIHQDATEHPEVWAWNGNTNVSSLEINLRSTNTNTYGNISANKDTELQLIPGGRRSAHYSGSIATNNSTDLCEAYTSRPTNVAVLFCIKYTESASAGSGSTYKEVDLISEPVEYNMGTSATSISQNLVFNDSVTNYNEVVFIVDVYHSNNKAYYARTNVRMLVSGITFNDSDAAGADGNSFYLNIAYGIGLDSKYQMGATNAFTAGVHFRNETTLRIRNTTCTIAGYTKFRIVAVKGIKY